MRRLSCLLTVALLATPAFAQIAQNQITTGQPVTSPAPTGTPDAPATAAPVAATTTPGQPAAGTAPAVTAATPNNTAPAATTGNATTTTTTPPAEKKEEIGYDPKVKRDPYGRPIGDRSKLASKTDHHKTLRSDAGTNAGPAAMRSDRAMLKSSAIQAPVATPPRLVTPAAAAQSNTPTGATPAPTASTATPTATQTPTPFTPATNSPAPGNYGTPTSVTTVPDASALPLLPPSGAATPAPTTTP